MGKDVFFLSIFNMGIAYFRIRSLMEKLVHSCSKQRPKPTWIVGIEPIKK